MKIRCSFALKDSRQTTTSVIACVYFGGKRLRFASGEIVKPSNWSAVRQRVKAGDPLAAVINDRLDKIAVDLGRAISDAQEAGNLTALAIRERYDKLQASPSAPVNFFEEYERWIDTQQFTAWTKLSHHKSRKHLKTFADSYDPTLTFNTMTFIVWERFVRYLQQDKQLVNVSVWSVVKSVKRFIADQYEKGVHHNGEYLKVTRKALLPTVGSSSGHVHLSEEELSAIIAFDLTSAPRLARVRDLFTFICHTGLRFADTQRIGPDNVHPTDTGLVLRFVTMKNRSQATIPLVTEAQRIWTQYNGVLPRITNSRGNRYITEVLKRVAETCPSLAAMITITRYRGADCVERTIPKYRAVAMHTGKRTYISLSVSKGVMLETLARSTGNTLQTLRGYDVRPASVAAEAIREAWDKSPKRRTSKK